MEKIWLKEYLQDVPENINPEQYCSIDEMFEHCVSQYKNYSAFSSFDVSITYQELSTYSLHFATFLQQELKLKKGERVAIMMPNLLQYPICVFGILKAGCVVVNVNPLYTARELKHQLQDAGVSAVIVLANFAHTLQTVLEEVSIRHVIVTRIGDLLGFKGSIINFAVKYVQRKEPAWKIAEAIPFPQTLTRGKASIFQKIDIQNSDAAFLQYTGGTTGVPKGAVLTHRNVVANVLQCKAWVRSAVIPGKEKVIGALPFYHIFALTVCSICFMLLGGECVLITNPRDLRGFIKTLIKHPPTIFIGLNTLFNGLLNQEEFKKVNFSQLKLTVAGGMPTLKSVADRWQEVTESTIVEGYGLTESSPVVSINPINLKKFNGSIGLPVSSTDVKICDEHDQELVCNQRGELLVKGPQVMRGYWNNPAETSKILSNDGWLRTGDIAYINEQGFIFLVDRKKDMILVSGFNVYPTEIEEVIAMVPGVKEVAVIGIPDPKSEEAVKAFVVKTDPTLTEQQIVEFCRKNLTGYKTPKIIEFRDELPKSNVGKVLRRELH